ncbi:hypothetical protein PIB30_015488 [Stylosanthes scabra]|uniref:Uncharacterized protein n=1 Tax=Stylosanthes scabra TaxID=79078 RepID=A0ABU6W737_9FABA|nr:hypothetical protein [Stylosanthes scabra]
MGLYVEPPCSLERTKVPDCNTSSLKSFSKQRAEEALSNSQVVNIKKGSEVDKPPEWKRPVSMKRLRSEEGSGKKVIDLTERKCCGKEFSFEDAINFTKSQKNLHGFNGTEDLTSVWGEHFPFNVVADEHVARARCKLYQLGFIICGPV